jgi:hypothetical protein
MPDGFLVRLLVDEGGEVQVGHGVLRVRHRKNVAQAPTVAGEITMRSDRVPGRGAEGGTTEREAGLRVTCAGGSIAVPEGVWVSVGRSDPAAGAGHLGLPGASGKVNRRQLSLRAEGAAAWVRRESGANPVQVNGRPLAEGEEVSIPLPVELVLSNGDWRGTLCR